MRCGVDSSSRSTSGCLPTFQLNLRLHPSSLPSTSSHSGPCFRAAWWRPTCMCHIVLLATPGHIFIVSSLSTSGEGPRVPSIIAMSFKTWLEHETRDMCDIEDQCMEWRLCADVDASGIVTSLSSAPPGSCSPTPNMIFG
jgi:hypothetical protein